MNTGNNGKQDFSQSVDLTALALGELPDEQRQALQSVLNQSPDLAADVDRLRHLGTLVRGANDCELERLACSDEVTRLKNLIDNALTDQAGGDHTIQLLDSTPSATRSWTRTRWMAVAATVLLGAAIGFAMLRPPVLNQNLAEFNENSLPSISPPNQETDLLQLSFDETGGSVDESAASPDKGDGELASTRNDKSNLPSDKVFIRENELVPELMPGFEAASNGQHANGRVQPNGQARPTAGLVQIQPGRIDNLSGQNAAATQNSLGIAGTVYSLSDKPVESGDRPGLQSQAAGNGATEDMRDHYGLQPDRLGEQKERIVEKGFANETAEAPDAVRDLMPGNSAAVPANESPVGGEGELAEIKQGVELRGELGATPALDARSMALAEKRTGNDPFAKQKEIIELMDQVADQRYQLNTLVVSGKPVDPYLGPSQIREKIAKLEESRDQSAEAADADYVAENNPGETVDYDEQLSFWKESLVRREESQIRLIDLQRKLADLRSSMEQYELPPENPFLKPVAENARSTFSIDVDTASYANIRRFITAGQLPPADAVRIEEMINYFSYGDPGPTDGRPFAVSLEVARCPWQPAHQLLRVGIKGQEVQRDDRPASNLVFLVDVSGSMKDANKLPLLQRAMLLLVDQLSENDRVSIVTYADNAGVRMQPVSGDQKQKIRDVIHSLSAGGSTHGSAGIQTAYDLASQHFIEDGTNRVLLATDGDLNVGVTDDDQLVQLIKSEARRGVFLSVLGFGTGNLKDAKLEKIANNGNGQYSYIDSIREAQKVLVAEMSGSLMTIAKDVKLQIEFNPAEIAGYRLIGYENRTLQNEDFANDRVDAGDVGAGHSVTALYELVPAGAPSPAGTTGQIAPALKYQTTATRNDESEPRDVATKLTDAARSGELMTLSLRYKQPMSDVSELLEMPVLKSDRSFAQASTDFRFAASVAAFGMKLRQSVYSGLWQFSDIENNAAAALGDDPQGHRAELVDLVRQVRQMTGR